MSQDARVRPFGADDLDAPATHVEAFTVLQQTAEARDAQATAAEDVLDHAEPRPESYRQALTTLEAILDGASPDDAEALKQALARWRSFDARLPVSPDDELVDDWRGAVYPYKNRLSRKSYERQKYHLQVETRFGGGSCR